jgi:predicted  nucleic acid-binding Zn-ribbon protein
MPIDMEHRLTTMEDGIKTNARDISDLKNRQDNLDKLVGSVEKLALREERVEKDVREIKTDVKALAEKPAKRWDDMVGKIFMVIATAIVTFLLSRIGL